MRCNPALPCLAACVWAGWRLASRWGFSGGRRASPGPSIMAGGGLLESPVGRRTSRRKTAKRPFRGKDKEELCRNIVSNTVQYPSFLSPQAVNILRWLLEKNPSRRLGAGDDAREVRRQAFFRMINWTKLQLRIMKPPLLPVIREEIISNSAVPLTTQRTSLTPEQQEAFIDFEWIADGTP